MSPPANDPTGIRVDVTIGFAIAIGRTTVEALDDVKTLLGLVENQINEAGGILILREVNFG